MIQYSIASQVFTVGIGSSVSHALVDGPPPQLAAQLPVRSCRGCAAGGTPWLPAAAELAAELAAAAQAQANAGASRQPIVKTLSPGLHVGVKMGGMGVAIGSVIGRKLAKMVLACE